MTDVAVISPNPALDRVALARGARSLGTVRAQRYLDTPGGKAFHVGLVAAALGADVVAVAPLGGRRGERVAGLLAEAGLALDVVAIAAETRGTYTVVDDDGDLIEVLEPPPGLTGEEAALLGDRAAAHAGKARVVVTAGSLPAGVDVGFHAAIATATTGCCIVDASGPALAAAIAASPGVVKPNARELADLDGGAASASLGALARRATSLTAGVVWVTLGARGSLLVSAGEAWHLRVAPPGPAVNAVGCGDALAGGLAAGLARGEDLLSAASLGVAAAASKLTYLHPAQIDPAAVESLAGAVARTRIELSEDP